MTGWDPEIIRPDERRLAEPMLHVARLVYSLVGRRLFRQGRGVDGRPLGRYSNRPPKARPAPGSSRATDTGAQGHYWAHPEAMRSHRVRQAAAFIVERGRFAGWGAFRSYAAFVGAKDPQKAARGVNFVNTGTLSRGMQIRPMGPTRVRISFYGGRRKVGALLGAGASAGRRSGQAKNNRSLARILSDRFGALLDVSAADMRQVNALVGQLFAPALLDMLRLAQTSATARKRMRTRNRALERVRAQYKKAQRGAE